MTCALIFGEVCEMKVSQTSAILSSILCRGGSRGRVQGVPPSPPSEMTFGFLIQLVVWYSAKKKTMWFIGVEVEQETSAPPPKKILDPPLLYLCV